MAENVLVDAGFLIALLSRRDTNHAWAVSQAKTNPPPWISCDAVLSEAFHLLGPTGIPALAALIRRAALASRFALQDEADPVLRLLMTYADIPMSLAEACLVRMSETIPDPLLLTTDSDFRIYRRLGRRTIPCVLPG